MIEIVTDPFPGDEALRRLWRVAWNDAGPESFQPLLKRSLAHVGAYDGAVLIGFVNVAWDGGIHAFILDTCVDPLFRRQGIASRLVGRAASADIRIDNPAFADRHARLELVSGEVWLRDLGSDEGSVVNGERVRDAILQPGDQVVFDANDRFVVEAPMREAAQDPLPIGIVDDAGRASGAAGRASGSRWRLPLVLLAAVLIAMLLGLLLLYGAG